MSVESLPSFFCPITSEVMTDPVISPDGQTYESTAIVDWFTRWMMTSPSTGAEVSHMTLTQNIGLWNDIEQCQESHVMYLWSSDIEMEGRPFVTGSFKNVYRGSLHITVWGDSSKRVTVTVFKIRRGDCDCVMEARILLKSQDWSTSSGCSIFGVVCRRRGPVPYH